MTLSLIILTYNRPDALALILLSIEKQTVFPDEVIIADDGSTDVTKELIKQREEGFPVPLKHVWHEDKGYRIAAIRNKAVRTCSGEFLIFSDGDLYFHPRFIEDFKKNAEMGVALIGSRVFLSEKATRSKIMQQDCRPVFPLVSPEIENNRFNSVRIPFVFNLLKPVKHSKNLRGGLLGVWKKDLEAVNGWNEAFTGWGLEDTEFVTRLFHSEVVFRKIKFMSLTYHLWHPMQKRENVGQNMRLLDLTIQKKLIKCREGLVRL